jgi:predicted esterase
VFVHRFEPARAPGSGRTILLLHGTGGDENDLLPLARMLDPVAAVLSPRGQVMERDMPRFFRRLAEGVYDVEDLVARAHGLADFVGAAATRYGFDPDRVIAAGFSNGANIATATLLLRPQALHAAILLHPMMPVDLEATGSLANVRVFIAGGRFDPVARPEDTERVAMLLESRGAQVTTHWEPAGHSLTQGEIVAARDWLKHGA